MYLLNDSHGWPESFSVKGLVHQWCLTDLSLTRSNNELRHALDKREPVESSNRVQMHCTEYENTI